MHALGTLSGPLKPFPLRAASSDDPTADHFLNCETRRRRLASTGSSDGSAPCALKLEPPFSVGPYTIHQQVGQGGMAKVYRATFRGHRGFIRPVALKMAKPGAHNIQRLWLEARLMHEIRDPRIPTVLNTGVFRRLPFYTMAWIDGVTVYDLLRGVHPMPLSVCLEFALAVCETLKTLHAHRRPIVHCDLKPGNLMLTTDGAISLIDFGIASFGGIGSPGLSPGTAQYMAPEQASGTAVDPRTDIFSFGVLLFELACSEKMFQETGLTLLRNRTLDDAGVNRARVVAHLSHSCPELIEPVLRCVSVHPRDRYQSVDRLEKHLRRVQGRNERGPSLRQWCERIL